MKKLFIILAVACCTSLFAQDCTPYDRVRVYTISENIFLIPLSELQAKGLTVRPEDITWYHVVGEIDAPHGETSGDDVPVLTGSERLVLDDRSPAGDYYAEINTATSYAGRYCGDVARTPRIAVASLVNKDFVPDVFPSIAEPGAPLTISGLPAGQFTELTFIDSDGRKVQQSVYSSGHTVIQTNAPRVPGCYLIRLTGLFYVKSLRILVATP